LLTRKWPSESVQGIRAHNLSADISSRADN
jgi:hypothetical protein